MNNQEMLNKICQEIAEERYNYKGPHCCLTMDAELFNEGTVLKYNQRYREYGIKVPESTGCVLMDHCISCGKKLPTSLRVEWYSILEQEYGLKKPTDEEEELIPQDFLTDEWWKKRGL